MEGFLLDVSPVSFEKCSQNTILLMFLFDHKSPRFTTIKFVIFNKTGVVIGDYHCSQSSPDGDQSEYK